MKKIMISPSKYVQGNGELSSIGTYIKEFSAKAVLVASKADRGKSSDVP